MTKDKLLKLLLDHKGEILSGPDLSKKLGVSRNSVWKAINALRKENHKIISVKNKDQIYNALLKLMADFSLYNKLKSQAREYIIQHYDQKLIWNAILAKYREMTK